MLVGPLAGLQRRPVRGSHGAHLYPEEEVRGCGGAVPRH